MTKRDKRPVLSERTLARSLTKGRDTETERCDGGDEGVAAVVASEYSCVGGNSAIYVIDGVLLAWLLNNGFEVLKAIKNTQQSDVVVTIMI